MKYLLAIIGFAILISQSPAQSNTGIIMVTVAPSGSCGSRSAPRMLVPNGTIYTCQNGTWAVVGGGAPSGAAGGDLGGTYPNPTVTGGSHITNSSIPNSGLANPATTVNGQTCTLGSTCTITAGTSLYTFTVPVLSNFTICSQCGTVAATVTDTGSGITIGGSNNTTGAYDVATGSAPWRAAAYIQGVLYNESFQGFGLYCREASSGKAKQYIIQINGSANIAYNTFNTGFAYVSTPKATSIGALGLGLNAGGIWMSLYDDNTNLRWQISGDGTNWVTWNTESRTTFATCDNVGITANGSTNYPPISYYRSWALTH